MNDSPYELSRTPNPAEIETVKNFTPPDGTVFEYSQMVGSGLR